jgi:hypothetical protein
MDKENMFYVQKTPETAPWIETTMEEKEKPPPPKREKIEEVKAHRSHPNFKGILRWLQSRLFDVAFVALLWFVSLFLASLFLRVSIFRLISSSLTAVLIYFGILIIQYFFLFFFFLGDTLGDRIFKTEDD